MNSETTFDVAIIGAGVAGLSAAYHLAEHASVVVIERESQPAYHSSGRSAAMFIEGYENRVVSDLTKASGDFFRSPPVGFCDHALLHPLGGLTAAGPGETAKLARYFETWGPRCPELKAITVDEALAHVPIIRREWLSGAVYDPSWQTIDVHELLTGFRRHLKQSGGHLCSDAEVTDLTRANDGWRISIGSQDHQPATILRAQVIVNAAGAWAAEIANLAGIPAIPLTPLRRSAAIVPAPASQPRTTTWPIVHTLDERLYFKPESGGLMVCPQDETPSVAMDAYPEDLDIAEALQRMVEVTTYEAKRVEHQWAGLRTFAPDRIPVLGFDPTAADFFWLAGQGGFGVQTAPALGAEAAHQIQHEGRSSGHLDAHAIRPDRAF